MWNQNQCQGQIYNQLVIDFYAGEIKYQGNVNQFLKGLLDFDENTLDPLIIKILTNIFGFKIQIVQSLLKDLGKSAIVVEARGIALICDLAIDQLQVARDTLQDSLLTADLFSGVLAQIYLFKNEIYNIIGYSSFLIYNQAIQKLQLFMENPQIIKTQWIFDFIKQNKEDIQIEKNINFYQQKPIRHGNILKQMYFDQPDKPQQMKQIDEQEKQNQMDNTVDFQYNQYQPNNFGLPYQQSQQYSQQYEQNYQYEPQTMQIVQESNKNQLAKQMLQDYKQQKQQVAQTQPPNPYIIKSYVPNNKSPTTSKFQGQELKELWYNPLGVTQRYSPFLPTKGITLLNK